MALLTASMDTGKNASTDHQRQESAVRKLWTKNGRPLLNDGNLVMVPSGRMVGRIAGDRVFTEEGGTYVGTLVGDRLVFRSFDIDGPERQYTRPVTVADVDEVPPARMWGDEPVIPD